MSKLNALTATDYSFPGQTGFYRGKVRDVYEVGDLLVMVATDRISAFDVVLPKGIPYKGQVLNQVAAHFLDKVGDILPTWRIASPDPNVSIGYRCEPLRVEMVIRGYCTGHAWREYQRGKREICGVPMPQDLCENDPFPEPVITPSTKAEQGHDEDISAEEIIRRNIVPENTYRRMEAATRELFARGTEMAAERGLILVDTKYEFGLRNGELYLIDEIHTPDSSRYFYAEGYAERQRKGEKQRQLSKEFVREWLMAGGFSGKEGQKVPEMDDAFVQSVSERYIELYEIVSGKKFTHIPYVNIDNRIYAAVCEFLNTHG